MSKYKQLEANCQTFENATHRLACSHSYNSYSRVEYFMPCHVLKELTDGRLKVLVHGDRFYNRKRDKKRVRYVDGNRVTIIEDGKND